MTADSRHAEIEDHSTEIRRPPRGLSSRSQARRRRGYVLFLACLMQASVTLAAERVVMEDISVPVPATGGAFESLDGDYESVLVDDGVGEDGAVIPAQPQDMIRDHDYGGTSDGLHPSADESISSDNASAMPEAFSWDSITAAQPVGSYGPGMFGGRSGADVCRDGHDDFCESGGICHDGCPAGSRWAIQTEALVLWRNNIANQPLLAGTDGQIALDAGDVRTAAAAGPRIGVLHNLGCGRALEGAYFNVGGIQGRTSTDGLGAPYTGIGLANYPFSDIEEADYTTRGQIKSAELNYRWCQGGRVIWLAGFRWVEWNETATIEMQPAREGAPQDVVQANAGNDLYGGQFGCRVKFWDLGKWQVGAVGKAGVFGNTAYQRTSIVTEPEPFGPVSATGSDVAFFGEVGLNSTLWLNRWLAWRLGYNFFWLEGVATAAEQFPLASFESPPTASINTGDAVFLQGVSTGLEARW
jgi:hypothetical protein